MEPGREAVRVLHLIKGLGPGGAERLLVSLAEVADRDAVEYEIAYLLDWKQHLVPELDALGVPTHLLAGRRGLADPRWPGRLRRLARSFDIVHVHSPAVAAVARLAIGRSGRGASVVSTEHNVWASHGRVTRVANALTVHLDRQRWAVSEEVAVSSRRRRAGIDVLVHGVAVARLRARAGGPERDAARAARDWTGGDVVVATVANLRANKDYPTLFRAAARAVADEPSLRFVSIGQGPLEAELRAELAGLGMGDRFQMLGYHDDPPAVLAGADLFTLSSIHEGLPIALLEAMAMGLAPVVTAVGGNAEVVTDGLDGVVVAPRDPEALAASYVALARDRDRRAALGTAAARRAGDFDIAVAARTIESRYRQLVEDR